jgi:hypothetical protein
MRIDMNARTADILATVAGRPNPPFCVGFAAENQDVGAIAEEELALARQLIGESRHTWRLDEMCPLPPLHTGTPSAT